MTRSSCTTGRIARELLVRVVERAQHKGTGPIATLNTPYVNTIPAEREAQLPGDRAVERRLRSIVRWNAMAMVVRANKRSSGIGGHIASYQSLAVLYEVGFNHFWRGHSNEGHGKSRAGAHVREHFFGKDPALLERVAHMSDEEIWLLTICPSPETPIPTKPRR